MQLKLQYSAIATYFMLVIKSCPLAYYTVQSIKPLKHIKLSIKIKVEKMHSGLLKPLL